MFWDNWAQQTYDVFKAVLSRPRFGLTLAKEAVRMGGSRIACFRHAGSGDLIAFIVVPGRSHSSVNAFEISDLEDCHRQGKFRFHALFNKEQSPPMRKEALKLAKKISQKEIFDVMHS